MFLCLIFSALFINDLLIVERYLSYFSTFFGATTAYK